MVCIDSCIVDFHYVYYLFLLCIVYFYNVYCLFLLLCVLCIYLCIALSIFIISATQRDVRLD